MSDPWQSPTNDQPDQPHFGPPAAGASWPAPGGPSRGWAPPPKPGLIPLRPLSFGALLGTPFQVLRRNPRATFGSALLVQAAITLITVVVVGAVTFVAFGRIAKASLDETEAVTAGATLSIVLSALVPVALLLVASALLQGVIVLEVARATLGEKRRLGELWRGVGRRMWPLAWWTVLLSLGLLVGIALVVGLVVLLSFIGGAGIALAIAVGVLGGLGLVVLGFWLFTKTSLVPSLIVLEHLGLRAAVGRSWSLTNGYFWRTLGVQFLVATIVNVIAQVVTTPVGLLFGFAMTLVDPNAAFEAYIPSVILYVLILFLSLVLGAVAAVVQSATTALIYVDLRMRKEGLDLELARYVEAGQRGGSVPDPYLREA